MTIIRTAAAAVLAFAGSEAWAGQSLGELAAAEAARRRAIVVAAPVMTTANLPLGPPAPPPDPAATADSGAGRLTLVRSAARLRRGAVPEIPVQAVSSGEVALEVAVSATGAVTGITVLRDTPPFTEALGVAVRSWRFEPALDTAAPPPGETTPPARRSVASRVLVLGLFRPPALFAMTLGTPPETVGTPSDAVPAPRDFPPLPRYPPNALFDGVVLAELAVGADGAVAQTRIVESAPAFDQPTLAAVSALAFRPASAHGRGTAAYVYVVAAFRQPVTP